MSVAFSMFSEIYNLLLSYDELPKINKNTFINWYSNVWTDLNIVLNTLIMTFKDSYCELIRNEELQVFSDKEVLKIQEEINLITSRYLSLKAFW